MDYSQLINYSWRRSSRSKARLGSVLTWGQSQWQNRSWDWKWGWIIQNWQSNLANNSTLHSDLAHQKQPQANAEPNLTFNFVSPCDLVLEEPHISTEPNLTFDFVSPCDLVLEEPHINTEPNLTFDFVSPCNLVLEEPHINTEPNLTFSFLKPILNWANICSWT